MREMALAKRISVAIGCVLVAACGGGSSGSGVDSAPPLATNSPPHIVGAPPVIAQVGQPYEFAPTATDADGDTLTFAIENRPEWALSDWACLTARLADVPIYATLPSERQAKCSSPLQRERARWS